MIVPFRLDCGLKVPHVGRRGMDIILNSSSAGSVILNEVDLVTELIRMVGTVTAVPQVRSAVEVVMSSGANFSVDSGFSPHFLRASGSNGSAIGPHACTIIKSGSDLVVVPAVGGTVRVNGVDALHYVTMLAHCTPLYRAAAGAPRYVPSADLQAAVHRHSAEGPALPFIRRDGDYLAVRSGRNGAVRVGGWDILGLLVQIEQALAAA